MTTDPPLRYCAAHRNSARTRNGENPPTALGITQSSGKQTGNGPTDYSHKVEVNSTVSGAQSVSNREYEQRLQDQKRLIKLLNPQFLQTFLSEFNDLIRG